MSRLTLGLLSTFMVILLGSGILAYIFGNRSAPNSGTAQSAASASPAAGETSSGHGNKNTQANHALFSQLFGPDYSGLTPSDYSSWEATAARITLRFSLAAFLAAMLAFRPRRGLLISQRNPYVAQTQILMAVVAAAMMMVVGDSAARAFGIFAAASGESCA
jgi:hypothetical protein